MCTSALLLVLSPGEWIYEKNSGGQCRGICLQRLRALSRPTKYWGPALIEHRRLVDYVEDFVVDPWTDDNISTSDGQTLAEAIDDTVRIPVLYATLALLSPYGSD